jgi:alkylglycerol monooxygenase
VVEKYPVFKIENPYNFQKYYPKASNLMVYWTWGQFLITFAFLFFFYGNIAKLGVPNMFVYGGFLFLTIYAYTELMDRNPNAIYWEILKNVVGLGLIYYYGDWFGNGKTWVNYLIGSYFVFSSVITFWFVWFDFRKDKSVKMSVA